ncbi:hypothetical protein CLG96_10850 [Sphingomonas oleivorans]|uniref:TonB-dependent receptor-like beta-barrel domain-containing protein n=1 Tax=Sphingomonas oleivorans TaxID=1735121 RepID=A0A2T5FXL1_9SPHN|nr:hypothetical protein CLG96_10850 [Sphingomonas oleivorans]
MRGLPVTGGYRYAPQLIDGLPTFEDPETPFMNNDVFIRVDLMTERVEAIKGGPGGILYSNGLGAVVNYITRTGKQEFEGGYKIELSDYGLVRNEAFVSGPINKNLTFALGGFYRISNGMRDVGFTADNGGQIRGNLVYKSDDESTVIETHALILRDKTAFYQNIPFTIPAISQRGTPENPTIIDQDNIQSVGINFRDGALTSPGLRYFELLDQNGRKSVDIADGINPEFDISTIKFSKELDSGWKFGAGLRYTTGVSGFNAIFVDPAVERERFLSQRANNEINNPAFVAAQNCDLDDVRLTGYFSGINQSNCGANLPASTLAQFVQQFANYDRVQANYLDTGKEVTDAQYLNLPVPFITTVEADSFSGDFRIQKSLNLAGKHDLTLGGYVSNYNYDMNFQAALLVSDVSENARLIDLIAVDANGQQVGPSLTDRGVLVPSLFGQNSDAAFRGYALYALDHWELFDNRLKIDMGVRWQKLDVDVVTQPLELRRNLTPSDVEPGSTEDTLADNLVNLPGDPRFQEKSYDAFGWSIGGNYSFTNNFAIYGLVSDSFRLPSPEDVVFRGSATNQTSPSGSVELNQVERILQIEGGTRYFSREFDAALAVFYNDFSARDRASAYRDFTDPSCAVPSGVSDLADCPIVDQVFNEGVSNIGVEFEAGLRPTFLEGFELKGSFVYQKPEFKGTSRTDVRAIVDSLGTITGYEFTEVNSDGRRPQRLSEILVNVRPSFDFKPTTGLPLTIYGQMLYFSDRFASASDIDVTVFPSYTEFDIGALVNFTEGLTGQVHVNNLTNAVSLTEGGTIGIDNRTTDGTRNFGVGRPLFGRIIRASLTYRF